MLCGGFPIGGPEFVGDGVSSVCHCCSSGAKNKDFVGLLTILFAFFPIKFYARPKIEGRILGRGNESKRYGVFGGITQCYGDTMDSTAP